MSTAGAGATAGFAFASGRRHDLLCLGRAGVDLYALQDDTPLEQVGSFRKSVGGSPANIATALARLGGRAAIISMVSDDGFGRYVRTFLQAEGIDVQGLQTAPAGARNSTAFTEMRPDDCQVIIYRQGAADLLLHPQGLDGALIAGSRALLVTGTALSMSPSREAALHAMQLARAAGTVVVLDLDYRPYGWSDVAQAAVYLRLACGLADMVIGNREEFDVLEHLQPAAARDDRQSAQRILQGPTVAVVVKDGARGCQVFLQGGHSLNQGIFAVPVRKPFGSGDAFAGALLWSLLQGQGWQEALRRGAAAAAINVSRDACAQAMASAQELDFFLQSHPEARA